MKKFMMSLKLKNTLRACVWNSTGAVLGVGRVLPAF